MDYIIIGLLIVNLVLIVISLFKNIESVSMVGTSLYDDIDSAVLAAFCSGRNSEYRSVSGTIVPDF